MSDLQAHPALACPDTPPSHAEYLGRRYVPELDGIRALSVLLVVSIHMYDAPKMWMWLAGAQGVTIFFVLSGYLITRLALREEADRGRVSLTAFYVRRSFRIFPCYYAILAAYCLMIFGLGLGASQRDSFREALPYFACYLHEVPFYSILAVGRRELPFMQSWSLGVEEKFYLIWPLLAFVLWRGTTTMRRAGSLVLSAVFLLVPLLIFFLDPELLFFSKNLYSYFSILIGCLLALLLDDDRWFGRFRILASRRATCVVVTAFLAIHFCTPHIPANLEWNVWGVVYTLGTAALLACVLLGRGWLQTVLAARPLGFIGRLSYGIYVVHYFGVASAPRIIPSWLPFPWRGVLAYLVACTLSVGAAWVMAWAVERPFIAWGHRISAWILAREAGSRAPASIPASVSEARVAVGEFERGHVATSVLR